MSIPIQISEEKHYSTFRSSQFKGFSASSNPLPKAPLVTFDLQMDELKDYLKEVSEVINSHDSILKSLIDSLK